MELPIYHDQEGSYWRNDNNCDFNSLTDQTIAFSNALGLNCGIYTFYNWATNGNVNIDYLRNYMPFWLAQYNSKPDLACDIWQYTSDGEIAGNAPFDLNVYTV